MSSSNSFDELTLHSRKIERSVDEISEISSRALKDFEKLKYRKINVENLLNTMTAFTELNRILPLLESAIERKNLDDCARLAKNYEEIKRYLLPEFSAHLFTALQTQMDRLRELAKTEFQAALKENNAEKLNKCSALSKILGFEETSLDKILDVYAGELRD